MQYRLTFGSQPERVQARNYKNKLQDYIIFLFLKWDAGKKGIQVCKWRENEEKEHKVMGKKKEREKRISFNFTERDMYANLETDPVETL